MELLPSRAMPNRTSGTLGTSSGGKKRNTPGGVFLRSGSAEGRHLIGIREEISHRVVSVRSAAPERRARVRRDETIQALHAC
jgi:hypothetical protein